MTNIARKHWSFVHTEWPTSIFGTANSRHVHVDRGRENSIVVAAAATELSATEADTGSVRA